ncbi:MAG: polyphosphate polymerase domain-containing protein [Clostridiales bacterium]|nr:polyphosphate polymerase domain-containing protein [Clostridiales bacterium]
MKYQSIFRRYEIKYILNSDERARLMEAMDGIMKIDRYGKTTIRNIYFDTDNYRLIRTSLDKPPYKEKLRIRSYKRVTEDEDVFVEIKKKYDSVVYKRRIACPEYLAMDWLAAYGAKPGVDELMRSQGFVSIQTAAQIADEIDYLRDFYETLAPKVFLSYEREAFEALDGSDIRITLDSNIMARDYDLNLRQGVYGENIIDRDLYVLEAKVTGAMPAWLMRFLRENDISKTSFSKYGRYYTENILTKEDNTRKRGLIYA